MNILFNEDEQKVIDSLFNHAQPLTTLFKSFSNDLADFCSSVKSQVSLSSVEGEDNSGMKKASELVPAETLTIARKMASDYVNTDLTKRVSGFILNDYIIKNLTEMYTEFLCWSFLQLNK